MNCNSYYLIYTKFVDKLSLISNQVKRFIFCLPEKVSMKKNDFDNFASPITVPMVMTKFDSCSKGDLISYIRIYVFIS